MKRRVRSIVTAKAILICGCLLFLLCGLFPPWLHTHSGHTVSSAGYCFLLTAPQPRGYNSGIRLDAERLAIEWLCILAGTGMGLVLVAKSGGGDGKAVEKADSDKDAVATPPPATETIEAAQDRTASKNESALPPVAKKRSVFRMILASFVCLAIMATALAFWTVNRPKPQPRTNKVPTWDETSPLHEAKPSAPPRDKFGGVAVAPMPTTNPVDVPLQVPVKSGFDPSLLEPVEPSTSMPRHPRAVGAEAISSLAVRLTGISTLGGTKKALLEIYEKMPGKRPKFPPPLAEGESEGRIEVVSIDPEKSAVVIKADGMKRTLTFEKPRQGKVATSSAQTQAARQGGARSRVSSSPRIAPGFVAPEVDSGHWIEGVIDGGSFVKLEDGSLWQISPLDTITSALWLPISDIVVIEGNDLGYPYKLINTDDRESVNARRLSR